MKGSEMTVLEAMQERQALQNLVEREMKRFVEGTGLAMNIHANTEIGEDGKIVVRVEVGVYLPD